MWQEVQDISAQENYHYLWYRAEKVQGDLFMEANEYVIAFRHYARSCQFSVKHNQHCYGNAVRTVSDRLLEIPFDLAPEILTSLIAFWTELGYATTYPQLIESCAEMQQLLGLDGVQDRS